MQYVFGYAPVKLGEVAVYSRKRISVDEMNENNYVGVENLLQNKAGKVKATYVPQKGNAIEFLPDDILIGNIRPYLKKIWFSDIHGGTNGDVLSIHPLDIGAIYPRFLYFVLSSDSFFDYDNQNSKGAKMPRGDKEAVMNYSFSIPNIEEQKRVVFLLDKFDSYCNDITDGLPTEIEARQKQYEYYRDKLLNMKRLEV